MNRLKVESIIRPESDSSEAYKMLRMNIEFLTVDKKVKTIMVTSSGFQEGKSYTASNLAVQLAQNGKKTIIIDCHQKKPDIHKFFKLLNEDGLTNIMSSGIKTNELIKPTSEENLYALVSGNFLVSSSKLFESLKFKNLISELKDSFDFIILDAPPLLVGADAQIISKYVDGCILVVAIRTLNREEIFKGKELLDKLNSNILGVVLNKIEVNTKKYYKYYKKNRKHK